MRATSVRPLVAGTPISDSLIIDVRRQLPWRRRLASDVGAAGLWAGWFWLCAPAVSMAAASPVGHSHRNLLQRLVEAAPTALPAGAAVVVGMIAALWLWSRLASCAKAAEAKPNINYAGHFGVNELHLHRCRTSQVCIVHHDETGRIVRIDAVSPASSISRVGGEVASYPISAPSETPEIVEAA